MGINYVENINVGFLTKNQKTFIYRICFNSMNF